MSCKTFNLKSCEIRGATYQGRKIDFVNKVITQDTFTAKVYDEQGYLLTEIIGLKSGSVVYFPFTAIQNLIKDKYRIKYLGSGNTIEKQFNRTVLIKKLYLCGITFFNI